MMCLFNPGQFYSVLKEQMKHLGFVTLESSNFLTQEHPFQFEKNNEWHLMANSQ
jgi:hypothetical protein